ncbi:MAG: serine/threonine-protein kinase RsbW [Candidatus Poribacteria bacterium]|nr:serine/threonine-protein kinase RsbW [Candidatus Poribacteria bacterium]
MEIIYRDTIDLAVPSRSGLEKVAIDTAASIAELMGFSEDRIEDLRTAVGEACINAIEHGNKQDSSIKVLVELIADNSKLQIDIHDQGTGINSKIDKPDIDAKIAGKQTVRGWGLFLIQSLMDEVQFYWSPEIGNITRMIIYLKK